MIPSDVFWHSCLLFWAGFLDLLIATLNFKFTQRNRINASAFTTYLHAFLLLYVISVLLEKSEISIIYVNAFALGSALGDYMALILTNMGFIDKIAKFNRQGRKLKRGKFFVGK